MNEPLILVVEDDANSVFFLEHTFEKIGLTNPRRVAVDGREAMDYLEGLGNFSDRVKFPLPGLVLLDLKMPRVSGFEVLRWMRSRPETKTLVVLILTSSKANEDIAKAYDLGANGYVVKPLTLRELEVIVRAVRSCWLTHNRAPLAKVA